MMRRRRKSKSASLLFPDGKDTWNSKYDAAWNEPSFPEPAPLPDTPPHSTFASPQLPYNTPAPVPVANHAPYSNSMVPDYPPMHPQYQVATSPFRQPRHPGLSAHEDAYATSAM
ncbi:hypothetical protein C8Q80DRAFT_1210795, partial [Daedaleopsis nitida]